MESIISQLKKDFRKQVFSFSIEAPERSTTSILTEEELNELQNAWVQLTIWKQSHTIT